MYHLPRNMPQSLHNLAPCSPSVCLLVKILIVFSLKVGHLGFFRNLEYTLLKLLLVCIICQETCHSLDAIWPHTYQVHVFQPKFISFFRLKVGHLGFFRNIEYTLLKYFLLPTCWQETCNSPSTIWPHTYQVYVLKSKF